MNKVGDHSSGIFETFVRTNTISNFLQVARKSCLELVRKGESPFPPPEAPLLDRV